MAHKRLDQLDPNFATQAVPKAKSLQWISHKDKRLDVRGLPWYRKNGKSFSRLPKRAEGVVRDSVWSLAQCPASARICFASNTTRVAVHLRNSHGGCMAHFAVSGSNGVFLYVGEPREMKPCNVAMPAVGETEAAKELVTGLSSTFREYTLYLPPYSPLADIRIGLSKGARLRKASKPALAKPAVFYGTSITQGGCASTAGADYVSILGRTLNLDVVNLGFSGNGRGEAEVAEIIAEIDASLYVLDYCANTTVEGLRRTLPRFIRILRKRRPKTPILLLSKICFYPLAFSEERRQNDEAQRDILISNYLRERRGGDENIHFADGRSLLTYAADLATVDGVHPTSVGFRMMAENLAPHVAYILGL